MLIIHKTFDFHFAWFVEKNVIPVTIITIITTHRQFSAVHSSGADCVGFKELQFMAVRACANYLAMQLDTSRLRDKSLLCSTGADFFDLLWGLIKKYHKRIEIQIMQTIPVFNIPFFKTNKQTNNNKTCV